MKNNINDNKIFSEVLSTGEILETIYDPKTKETNLVVLENGEPLVREKYVDSRGCEWLPFSSDSGLLKSGFVKLPSACAPYETVKKLYEEVKAFIAEYMNLPEDFLVVSSVYVMFTWVHDRFNTIPYLRVIGEFGTGKTRFLEIMGHLCYKSILAGGSISTSSVFRTIDVVRGTLVFDEADFKNSELWSEIVKILNSGHSKDTPVVRMNVDGKNGQITTQVFKVFGPKILASRERFGDGALESRCFTKYLLPIKKTNRPVHVNEEFKEKSEKLRNKLLAFRLDKYVKIKADEATLGGFDFPRLKQSALALTSVASIIGENVLGELNRFLQEYEKELEVNQKYDIKADILICIALILVSGKPRALKQRIRIKEIASKFTEHHYNDYSDKDTKSIERKDSVLIIPAYIVSPRKIGEHIRRLGISTERDNEGFYIPIARENEKIIRLIERYGLMEIIKDTISQKGERLVDGDLIGLKEEPPEEPPLTAEDSPF